MKVLTWFACTSDVLKSRFYCSKTIIFKDLHAFSKLLFLSTFLCIFPRFWCHFFTYFRRLFEYTFVHWFLTLFWPGRSLASWLHLASFGHAFFEIFDAKMAPKMTWKYTSRAPDGAQDHQNVALSLQTVALGASFGRLGPQSIYRFASVLNSFSSFPKNWGGEHNF